MSEDIPVVLCAVFFIIGCVITGYTLGMSENAYFQLKKSQWNCTQSRILDPQNVDKIECINYRKKENEQ